MVALDTIDGMVWGLNALRMRRGGVSFDIRRGMTQSAFLEIENFLYEERARTMVQNKYASFSGKLQ